MKKRFILRALLPGVCCLIACGLLSPAAMAREAATKEAVADLDKALEEAKEGSSEARQRLAVRRTIREAEGMLESLPDSPERFVVLEFIFRARRVLITLDEDSKHRGALLETARELVKAPDDLAELRLEADLLLSQAELARQGADSGTRAAALRPFIDRYLDTPVGAKVLRLAMVMALELGDNRLVTDIRELIEKHFAGDLEMIAFQRDKLGGQVFGAPFTGTFERTDGKVLRFPMDGLGRSTMCLFWSKDNGGDEILEALAAAALEKKEELAGRLEIISFNLDDLPDAGESVVRSAGVDWQVLRLPGGRKNPIYEAYVRSDPRRLTVSPTGYAAMIMTGSTRKKANSDGTPDYARMFGSTLARQWTKPRYVQQLTSLMAGDFLVLDPMGGIDPARPPELKAVATGAVQPLSRDADAVPEETLKAIQDCFVPGPERYRLSHAAARVAYGKAVDLCRRAIASHPQAPDLWIVRNRLMVALLGLWKTDADLARLEEAVAEAKTAVAAGYPPGCGVIARFCLARGAMHDAAADTRAIIDGLVAESGGASAPGSALAAAALLSLDVADRAGFERYREAILEHHSEDPMMWTFSAFLVDRYHRYWLFQVPFTAGWSYGRRENFFMTKGDREQANRVLRTELKTLDGETLRIPDDLEAEWTAIIFSTPGPWSSKRDDGLPPSPDRVLRSVMDFAAARPTEDVRVYLATLGGDAGAISANFGDKEAPCPVLILEGGLDNPLVHRLGMLSEDRDFNSVLLGKDGRIVATVSGLARQSSRSGTTLVKVIQQADEEFVSSSLESGRVGEAKDFILGLIPPFDPEAVDDRGRKLRKPNYSLAHLRARARVYAAIGELDLALADAEEVVRRQIGTDGGMSLRTDELDESERLRDEILKMKNEAGN